VSMRGYFFFLNDTATTEIYTLSLHDAFRSLEQLVPPGGAGPAVEPGQQLEGSEEHTSELQSRSDLVCRLLLEKKKNHTEAQLKDHIQRPTPARQHIQIHP